MNKPKKIVVICIMLLVAVAVALLIYFNNSTNTTLQELLQIDKNAVDVVGQNSHGSEAASIEIPGYGSMSLKADQIKQDLFLSNPEVNNCYFVISLFLPDGTKIYQSELIPPGKAIYSADFLCEVSAGTYENAILQYQCYRLNENQEKLNGARTHLTLIFE